MKVLINEKKTCPVYQIPCGSCFLAQRSNSKDEALYIKVDWASGALDKVPHQPTRNTVLALNLQTGQLRWFDMDKNVRPYEAEIR